MKRFFGIFLLLGASAAACSGNSDATFEPSAGSSHLRLEIACGSNADCPDSFECQTETEHGTTTSFCSSVDVVSPTGDGGARCPAGYEVEQEHGTSFCKPHGGHHGDDGIGGSDDGLDDHGGDDHGAGGDDHGGDDHGAGGDDHSGPGRDGNAAGGDDNSGPGHDGGDDHGAGGSHEGSGHRGK